MSTVLGRGMPRVGTLCDATRQVAAFFSSELTRPSEGALQAQGSFPRANYQVTFRHQPLP